MAAGLVVTILLTINLLVMTATICVFSVIELSTTNTRSMRSSWEDTDRRLYLLYDTWLYPVWMCVFVYQIIWLIYAFTTLRGRGPTFLYKQMPVMPQTLYIFVSLGTMFIIGWLFLFVDDYYFPLSSFCSVCSFILFGIALAISLYQMKKQKVFMELNNLEKDIIAIVTLVQNGIGVCLTWLLFISLSSALSILRFSHGIPTEDVTSAVLVTLLLYTVLWTILDMAAGRATTLYLFSPYVGLFVINLGILLRNLDKTEQRNLVVSIIAMALSFVLCIAKMVVLLINRNKNNPRTRSSAFLDDNGERFRSWRSSITESSRVPPKQHNSDAIRRSPNVYANTSSVAEYYNSSFQLRRFNINRMTS